MLSPNRALGKEEIEVLQTAEKVMSILGRYGNNSIEAQAGQWRNLHKLSKAIRSGVSIDMVLPAFPAKSPNRQKTLGSLPDYAELLGLFRLEQVCRDIGTVYGPGARTIICSDGSVFSDLVLVSDQEVELYQDAIITMIQDFGLGTLSTFHMADALPGMSYETMRAKLVSAFGKSVEAIAADAKDSPKTCALLNGIERFIFEDRIQLQTDRSRSTIRKESRQVAYQVVQRSNSWSTLVETYFPDAVRLSIHPQDHISEKLGFRLVDCDNRWGTPWHNVALEEKEGFRLVKRKEAEERGAVLAYAFGKYPYFREASL